jgi:hypothetical protein
MAANSINKKYPQISFYQTGSGGEHAPLVKSYDVEFNDSIVDTRYWKARSEGTKLKSRAINVYTAGDITYGKNPTIENKICALYVGTTIIGGDNPEDISRVAINGHSYITIDRILIINVETDEVRIVDRQSQTDITTGMVGSEIGFKRYITRDFPEGSEINIKLIDKVIPNSLKVAHRVKFNRGALMKLYEYTANDDGFEDGVFGGFGIRNNQEGTPLQIYTGSLEGKGLFGYGMTAGVSQSLFTTNSIAFVNSLPSELNDYIGTLNLATMGTSLIPLSASFGSGFTNATLINIGPRSIDGVAGSTGNTTTPPPVGGGGYIPNNNNQGA